MVETKSISYTFPSLASIFMMLCFAFSSRKKEIFGEFPLLTFVFKVSKQIEKSLRARRRM